VPTYWDTACSRATALIVGTRTVRQASRRMGRADWSPAVRMARPRPWVGRREVRER
jgi:hypothetical protein